LFNYCRLTVSVSDVKSPYLRVSESFWRASHTLRTSSQIMIRDRPTNLMCCWHLHRGKRREFRVRYPVPPGWLTVLREAWPRSTLQLGYVRCGARWSSTPQMIGCPQGSKAQQGDCYCCSKCLNPFPSLPFPSRKRAKPDSTVINLALPGHQPVGGAISISSSPACENQRGSQDTL